MRDALKARCFQDGAENYLGWQDETHSCRQAGHMRSASMPFSSGKAMQPPKQVFSGRLPEEGEQALP